MPSSAQPQHPAASPRGSKEKGSRQNVFCRYDSPNLKDFKKITLS